MRAALEQGTFREDLYYRLNVLPINIPPLRDRKEDIPFLVNHFIKKLRKDLGTPVESISDAAIERLLEYHWPGNVRELENVIERSMVLAAARCWRPATSSSTRRRRRARPSVDNFLPEGMTLDEFEQSIIREALHRANGNKSQAARLLGLDAQRAAVPAFTDGHRIVKWTGSTTQERGARCIHDVISQRSRRPACRLPAR